jgi:hypothetical protein
MVDLLSVEADRIALKVRIVRKDLLRQEFLGPITLVYMTSFVIVLRTRTIAQPSSLSTIYREVFWWNGRLS